MSEYIDIHTHKYIAQSGVRSIYNVRVGSDELWPEEGMFSAGIHPWDVEKIEPYWWDELGGLLRQRRCVAIGEAGLDYKYSTHTRARQNKLFESQILLAADMAKPLIIHTVGALEPTLERLVGFASPFVIHGFCGTNQKAERILTAGGYLSVSRCTSLDVVPLSRLLFETDQSELDIRDIYERVCRERDISPEDLKRVIIQNFEEIFTPYLPRV